MWFVWIGVIDKGGVCCFVFMDFDCQVCDLFVVWVKDIGCMVCVDVIGNIFVWCVGECDDLLFVVMGSYIDMQLIGGKFDGNYGVLVGFEVLCMFDVVGVCMCVLFEVVVWINEEGLCFVLVMMGFGVFVGVFMFDYVFV